MCSFAVSGHGSAPEARRAVSPHCPDSHLALCRTCRWPSPAVAVSLQCPCDNECLLRICVCSSRLATHKQNNSLSIVFPFGHFGFDAHRGRSSSPPRALRSRAELIKDEHLHALVSREVLCRCGICCPVRPAPNLSAWLFINASLHQ